MNPETEQAIVECLNRHLYTDLSKLVVELVRPTKFEADKVYFYYEYYNSKLEHKVFSFQVLRRTKKTLYVSSWEDALSRKRRYQIYYDNNGMST